MIDFGVTSGNADRTDLAVLTEYSWTTGKEAARHNEPKDAGRTGWGIWEPQGMAIVKDGVIKVWYGIVRGDREYLIFRRSTLTIEQHARELIDLLADEDPHDDPPEPLREDLIATDEGVAKLYARFLSRRLDLSR